MFGFLNINKPSGISSHKVIAVLRSITGIKQIGHAGTLDPLASGVLPVAVGKASRLIDYLPQDKCYKVTLEFGKISDTFDIEGKIECTSVKKITEQEVRSAVEKFRGEITQVPPAYSAVHYNGKRLYELAREGKIPDDIPSRKVMIYKNEIIEFDYDKQILKLEIKCSKGTYIRSIVSDLGKETGTGAVMTELTRTLSGGMSKDDSLELTSELSVEDILKNLIDPLNKLNMPGYQLTQDEYEKTINGNKFKSLSDYRGEILLCSDKKIIALALADGEYICPKKVLL